MINFMHNAKIGIYNFDFQLFCIFCLEEIPDRRSEKTKITFFTTYASIQDANHIVEELALLTITAIFLT